MRFIFLSGILLSTTLSAIVSIAPVDIGSNLGWSGNVSGSLSSKSGNTEKEDYSLGLRLQYDQASDYLIWGTVTYDYGKSNSVVNEDKMYLHLRSIHLVDNNDWCGEFFVQTEQDKFKNIQNRSVGGGGMRWRMFNTNDWGKGYVGAGLMAEHLRYTDPSLNPHEDNGRLNSYIAYTKNFAAASKISYIGYYQPKIDENSDCVTIHNAELIVPLYKNFNLSLSTKYFYDSRPPIGVKKEDTLYQTSFVWNF
jgi:putative salt-induced outer membrane protein